MDSTAVRFADPAALDVETLADDYADLARDDAHAVWCDEHRDAWMEALDATESSR